MKFSKKIPLICIIAAIILILISMFIDARSLEWIFGDSLRMGGFVLLILNPILGVLGSIFSIIHKQWLYLLLNLIMGISFIWIVALFGF